MLDMFRSSGFDLQTGSREGVVHVSLSLEPTGNFHTGALASSDAIVADLFRQAGIIRAGTLEEMSRDARR